MTSLLPFGKSILPYVLLANLPQSIISFLYLMYNGMMTCMLANREWFQYGIKRAPLRVSTPARGQRSTYFLQLPYTYSIPLLAGSLILHWLLSQSLFLARVKISNNQGAKMKYDRFRIFVGGDIFERPGDKEGVITTLGYSNIGFIASLVWGVVMTIFLIVLGCVMVYPTGIPGGGTNSAVISAACHVNCANGQDLEATDYDIYDIEMPHRPLKWGVKVEGGVNEVGHCCFSSEEVRPPVSGHLYAGNAGTPKKYWH
jgi:hypothetical protein